MQGLGEEEYFKKAMPEEVFSCLDTGIDLEARETTNTPMTAFKRRSAVPCGNRLGAR